MDTKASKQVRLATGCTHEVNQMSPKYSECVAEAEARPPRVRLPRTA